LLIKAFLFQAYFIPSGSMENTLEMGRLWVMGDHRFPRSFFGPELAELEVQPAAVPPGDGGIWGEAGLAEDG